MGPATLVHLANALAAPAVPSLDSGARLTRFEFERRYQASPPGITAELVEGVVYVASPAGRSHGDEHFRPITWLGAYTAHNHDVVGSDNATIRLDLDNEPQPDAHLRYRSGGRTHVVDDYVEGPPELVAEIAVSTPLSSRCVAKQCRSVCTDTGLWILASAAAALTALWTTDSLR